MRLLNGKTLLHEFRQLVRQASEIDVAVAWACAGSALELLQEAAARGVRLRAIVGLAGDISQPEALTALKDAGALRLADGAVARNAPGGLFHPKVFVFRDKVGRSAGWIGSANLSDNGFIRSMEAVFEVSPAAQLEGWFEELWNTLPADSSAALDAYKKSRKRPMPPGGNRASTEENAPTALPDLRDLKSADWAGYMHALSVADAYWRFHAADEFDGKFSVLAEAFSWVDTISTARIPIGRKSWDQLPDHDLRVLLGIGGPQGSWGLLGSMRRAVRAKGIFYGPSAAHKAARGRLRAALVPFVEASGVDASIAAALTCLEQMSAEHGISQGVATRLMACARPDIAISVNGGSAPNLGLVAGLPSSPSSLASTRNYERLLRWVVEQPWYDTPQPADAWPAMIWGMRAALIDCFVYRKSSSTASRPLRPGAREVLR
jgi:HKD family nuclease